MSERPPAFVEGDIYLRPLREEDAKVSWKWRNNPKIWEQTLSRPDREVTYEMELEWIRKAIVDTNSIRMAICLKEGDRYVGNVYVNHIDREKKCGYNGIFIGDTSVWGRGIGSLARNEMCRIAHRDYGVNTFISVVKKDNIGSIKTLLRSGHVEVSRDEETVRMERTMTD